MTTFKQIRIGQQFEFATTRNCYDREDASLTGTFTRITARKYANHDGQTYRLTGSVETRVRPIETPQS